jgi:hypothetical protein
MPIVDILRLVDAQVRLFMGLAFFCAVGIAVPVILLWDRWIAPGDRTMPPIQSDRRR